MPRQIQLSQPSSKCLAFDEAELASLFHQLDNWKNYKLPSGELSVAFFNHTEMAAIHERFLDDATPTDVITFSGDPDDDFAGEICVGAEQAMEAAAEHGQSLSQELTLYLVHGWLHLAGLDDRTEAGRAEMRAAEKKALDWLELNGGIPHVKSAISI